MYISICAQACVLRQLLATPCTITCQFPLSKWNFPVKNTEVVAIFLLERIFLTQEWNSFFELVSPALVDRFYD